MFIITSASWWRRGSLENISWWSGHLCGALQHADPFHHVRVLLIQCLEPKLQQRHLVEKIRDFVANSKLENFPQLVF
jgi:hypothetical protein